MNNNKLADLSLSFAIKVLTTTEDIKRRHSIISQLERSATSIGTNIRESRYANSKTDFISKLHIALKECYETEYWLEILANINCISKLDATQLLHECGNSFPR